MTDLEMTKLCAEAMGGYPDVLGDSGVVTVRDGDGPAWVYDPLHDDAQAMALVKKFRMTIYGNNGNGDWAVYTEWRDSHHPYTSIDHDLNRAIVEFVAKMQAAKASTFGTSDTYP